MTETETTIMRTEIARVMSRAHPPVVMSLEDVAAFFGFSKNYVTNDIQNRPDFPAKLDRFAHPRWSRKDIMEWARVSAQ